MCGIIGIWDFKNRVNTEEFALMRDTMQHRGPDGEGMYVNKTGNIALGHRRLSLIDLSESGSQPMCNEDKTIWLTINGEIYNYKLLKKELEAKGHHFKSSSDSEILIHGYEEWGTDILNKLKGMFAFCIYDQNKQIFFIARDRFGIKPCYYYHLNDVFLFASELKAIVAYSGFNKEIDMTSVSNYFTYRYVPSPATIWKNTCKIPPTHYLLIDANQKTQLVEYWKLQSTNNHFKQDYLIEKTDFLLTNSVKEHLESDVEVGSFLSGGYDSSAVVYYMNKIKYPSKSTFSIGFKGWEQSEHQYAEMVSSKFKTNNTVEILDETSLGIIDDLVYFYDEPIADISIVPTYFVSRMASAKVKAVLSGEGSDEIFGGYTWHRNENSYLKNLFSVLANKHTERAKYSVSDYANAMSMGLFDKKPLMDIIGKDFHTSIPEDPFWFYRQHYKPEIGGIKTFQYMDIKTFMGELVLTKIDRASMANSLEVRVPFLDHELVEFLFSLTEKDYIKKHIQKFLLFENIKNHLPKEILQRKKQGFVGPDSYYMNLNWYSENLKNSKLVSLGIINKGIIDELIMNKDHWRLWKILLLERWSQRWL